MTAKNTVHDPGSMLAQRRGALARDLSALTGMEMYAQIFLGLSLYVYDHVSTPGYLSLLLTLPFLLILLFWSRWLGKNTSGTDGIWFQLKKPTARCLSLLLFLWAMLDAALLFYGLCVLFGDVMNDLHPLFAPAAVILFTALSLIRPGEHSLPRLAHLLRWIVGGMLLYCAAAAISHGSAAHFYPLLGYGFSSIVHGGLWMCGAVSGCCLPLLLTREESSLSSMTQKASILFRPALVSFCAGLLTMLAGVWLMPAYALAGPHTMGWKLLLVAHMTPSVPAWSLEVLGLTLLILLTLCSSLTRASVFLSISASTRKANSCLPSALTLLLLTMAFLPSSQLQNALIGLSPYRAAAVIIVLAVLTFSTLRRKRKTASGKESSP